MLKIRMQRVGRKHQPLFRLVLTDSENGPKSGKFLEILGSYDTRNSEKAEIKTDRIKYWISNGAKLSPTTHNLLIRKNVISGKKINVLPKGVLEAAKTKKEAPVEKAGEAPISAQNQPEPEAKVEEVENSEENGVAPEIPETKEESS